MVGANLDAIPYVKLQIARAGFTYSMFVEKVGPGREPWYGPFEDDITHAFQYGIRADGSTLLPLLRYMKTGVREAKQGRSSGMRVAYDNSRAVQLQRIFPESAKINIRAKHANGKGEPRIFHTMLPGAIRNPMVVTDPQLFGAVKSRMEGLLLAWREESKLRTRAKIEQRIATGNPTTHVRYVNHQVPC